MQYGLGGNPQMLQMMMQNPAFQNMIRQRMMAMNGNMAQTPQAAMQGGAGVSAPVDPRMMAMQQMAQRNMAQGGGAPAVDPRQMMMQRQMQGNPAQSPVAAQMMNQQGPQGGYSPNNAAQGNPVQQQAMNQNQFMQQLQQRLQNRVR